MVSRWREYMTTHSASPQHVSNQAVISRDELSDCTNGSGKLQDSMLAERSSLEKDTNLSGIIPNDRISSQANAADGERSFPSVSGKTTPLEAQVPPHDIFSKNEMSIFLGSKKISKPSYSSNLVKRLECLPDSRNMHNRRLQGGVIISSGNNPEHKIVGPEERSNGSAHVDYPSGEPQITDGSKWKLVNVNTSSSSLTTVNGSSEREMDCMTNVNDIDNVTTNSQRFGDDEDKAGEDSGFIEGDMCASSTGVVRVQSRKKAEMFLVRTDGFSCVREKATESSLAFTHPSTQQQMLMWKSTPKTVLLLKKPGEQLMEEAKEVIFFRL